MGYVKDFIEHAVVTYMDEPNADVDKKCLFYYQRARKEIREWLKKVLLKELSDGEYTEVHVLLYLPLGDMEVRLEYFENEREYQSGCVPEMYHTPIGIMDWETCQAIIREKDNPVAMLYDYLFWHMTEIRSQSSDNDMTLLRGDILEYDRIKDVLGLHKMEYVFYSCLEFLSEDYWAK